jgi:ribosome-binding protein aMBF1 (putative translation factor)
MSEKIPPSRPALRRSVDATVHPALAGRSAAMPAHGGGATAAQPPAREPGGRKTSHPATSDVLRPTKKDPPVKLSVVMPKSMRKRLRKAAEQRGLQAEQLAAQFIADGIDRA